MYPGKDILTNIYSYDLTQDPTSLGLDIGDLLNQIENLGLQPFEFIAQTLARYQGEQEKKKRLESSSARAIHDYIIKIPDLECWKLMNISNDRRGSLYMELTPYPAPNFQQTDIDGLVKMLESYGSIITGSAEEDNGAFTEHIMVDGDLEKIQSLYRDLRDLEQEAIQDNKSFSSYRI